MRRRAYFSFFLVSVTAVFSAILLWQTIVKYKSLDQLGLVGVFLASMLSHLTVVARDMFIPVFLHMAPKYNPLILGGSAGLGGALGEVTTYLLGWGIAESVRGNQSKMEDKVAKWVSKYGLWAVLLVSLTPLPDTPVVLLAGSNRLPFTKLLIVEVVGKTAYYTLGAVIGTFIFTGLTEIFGTLLTSAIIVTISIMFCILVTFKRSRDALFGWLSN